MKQVKIFRAGPFESEELLEQKINSWIEEMSENPTFRLKDTVKMESPQNNTLVVLFLYIIESEKEKEKRHKMEMEMAKILADPEGLIEY